MKSINLFEHVTNNQTKIANKYEKENIFLSTQFPTRAFIAKGKNSSSIGSSKSYDVSFFETSLIELRLVLIKLLLLLSNANIIIYILFLVSI